MPFVLAAPAMAPLIFALAVLLIFFGARALFHPLQVIFRAIPFIGQQLADAIGTVIARAGELVGDLIDVELQAATNMTDWLAGHATLAIRALAAVATWLGVTVRVNITFLLGWADLLARNAAALATRLAATAATLAATVARVAALALTVGAIIATRIPAAIAAAVSTAVARASALVAAARAAATAAIATALAAALRAVGLETAARAAGDLAARSWATALVAAQAAATVASLAQLQAWAAAQVAAMSVAVGRVDARIGPIAAPTVAVAIGVVAAELSTLRRTCIDPQCSWLRPQLQALTMIEDAAMLAAVTALLAEAVNDPERAAADAIAESRPLIDGARGLLGELTGVAL